MSRASKFRMKKKQLEEINSHLFYLISSLNKKDEVEDFLESFLTKEEKIMLAKRLALFMMIKKHYSPSVIQRTLHISYETVRIYQNLLLSKNGTFQRIMKKLIERQESMDLFSKIDKLLKPLDLALRSKTDMKARAKFASGDWT